MFSTARNSNFGCATSTGNFFGLLTRVTLSPMTNGRALVVSALQGVAARFFTGWTVSIAALQVLKIISTQYNRKLVHLLSDCRDACCNLSSSCTWTRTSTACNTGFLWNVDRIYMILLLFLGTERKYSIRFYIIKDET